MSYYVVEFGCGEGMAEPFPVVIGTDLKDVRIRTAVFVQSLATHPIYGRYPPFFKATEVLDFPEIDVDDPGAYSGSDGRPGAWFRLDREPEDWHRLGASYMRAGTHWFTIHCVKTPEQVLWERREAALLARVRF